MSKHKSVSSETKLDWVAYSIYAVFGVALVLLIARAVPEAFQYHGNLYALISVAGFVTNLTLLVMLFRRPTHAAPLLWFALFVVTNLLWGIFEFMQRLMVSPDGNAFWSHINLAIVCFLPAFFYLFARSYTSRSRTESSIAVPAIIIGATLFISVLISGDNVFPRSSYGEMQAWGFPAPQAPASFWLITWVSSVTLLGVSRLVAFYHGSTNIKDRQQTTIVIIGATTLAFTASATAFILPAMGIHAVPPLGVLANALFAAGIIYTIYKHDVFSVNMAQIADTVLEAMAEAVFVTDRNYRVLYSNRTAERLLAHGSRPLVGQKLTEIADGRLADYRPSWESRLAKGQEAIPAEITLQTRLGPVTVNLNVSPVTETQQGYAFVLSDVTQLKAYSEKTFHQAQKLEEANKHLKSSQSALMDLLEESRSLQAQLKSEKAGIEQKVTEATAEIRAERARLEASINSLSVGFIMTDVHGSLLTINREVQHIIAHGVGLKRTMLEKIDLKTFETILARTFKLRAKIKHSLKTGESIKETNINFQDSVLTLILTPIIDGAGSRQRILGVVILIEDITEAVALQRSRDEFFSIASHELRTPLTAIRGNTQMIKDYYSDQLKDPDLKDMLSDIHNSSVRLITIVNDFLDTSRLEQGKIKFNPSVFSPLELAQDVIREFESSGINPGIYLKIEKPGRPLENVRADRDRLKQVLINLIGNALKFTEQGGVTVSFASLPKSIAISVTDTGKGIPLESQHLLFRKFQQASDNILTRDSTRSTGLGLYISRLIMTAMKGTIELEHSEADKGSTFAVTVPIAHGEASAEGLVKQPGKST